jgi:predicted lipoprotein with Yx(FWY)xxD motif
MRKLCFAGAAAAALLAVSCGPGYEDEDDVDDVEELPDPDDLDEPSDNDIDRIGDNAAGSLDRTASAERGDNPEIPSAGLRDMAATQTITLTVQQTDDYGPFLTDGNGRPLYMFTADTREIENTDASLACSGSCLDAWPPAATLEEPFAANGVDESLIGVMEFGDRLIATYDGWPLYYFSRDGGGAAEPKGQDIGSYGGLWKLVTPDGLKVGESRG